jgi:beta-lactamase superfamily II metal-dependent hydrolase
MTLSLDVLPATFGDALVVTYGTDGSLRRVIIDGGPAATYQNGLRTYIAGLPPEQRAFELAVVTHVDADHIDGGLLLFRDDALGVQIGDAWFNGWPQINPPTGPDRGALQGAFLSDLLESRPWNTTYCGGPVVRDLGQKVTLAGGAELRVLSPTPAKLDLLRKEWVKTVTAAGFTPGDNDAVAKRLSSRYQPKADLPDGGADRGAATPIGGDTAVANGSSIALLFTYDGKQLLLGSDAHADVVTEALEELAESYGTERISVDLFKLAHHGSAGNISPDLLAKLRCDRFVVSTNGDHFHHPDVATIELLGNRDDPPTVYFNYLSDTTKRWADPAEQARIGIKAVHGGGHLHIEL